MPISADLIASCLCVCVCVCDATHGCVFLKRKQKRQRSRGRRGFASAAATAGLIRQEGAPTKKHTFDRAPRPTGRSCQVYTHNKLSLKLVDGRLKRGQRL